MNILVLGGTQFVGRHLTRLLLAQEHTVTLIHRGKTNPTLFPEAAKIVADRDSTEFGTILKQTISEQGPFDAAIDMCGYYPANISLLLQALKESVRHYIFVSSVSAYENKTSNKSFFSEVDPTLDCNVAQSTNRELLTYGERKAECERVALAQSKSGIPVTIFRPSLIYGEYDPTDRFAYWIYKVAQKKPFLLPDDGMSIVQKTYAPDFAAVIAASLSKPALYHSAFNVAELLPLSWRDILGIIGRHLNTDPFKYAVSVSSDWLLEHKLNPWSDLPLWLPKSHLLIDTAKLRNTLAVEITDPERALAKATEAWLSLHRPPKTGINDAQEEGYLKLVRMN